MNTLFNNAKRAYCDEAEAGAASIVLSPYFDQLELRRFAHRIGGCASIFGATRTAFVATALENETHRCNVSGVTLRDLVDELVVQIAVDCRALRASLK